MKPYNWRTDYDWTDPDDYPVQDDKMFDIQSEEELMLPHEIKGRPKGIESLKEEETIKVAGGGARGWKAQEIAMDWAWERYGKEFHDLSHELQMQLYGEALDFVDEGGMAKGGRAGLLRGGDPEDPEIVEDDLSTMELMQDQGIPYGPQASGINRDILIKKVVEEFKLKELLITLKTMIH